MSCKIIIDEERLKDKIFEYIKSKQLTLNNLVSHCSNLVKCSQHNNNYRCELEQYSITEQNHINILNKFGFYINQENNEIKVDDIITFLRYFYYININNFHRIREIHIEDLKCLTSMKEYNITKLLYSTGYKVGDNYKNDGIIKRQNKVNI